MPPDRISRRGLLRSLGAGIAVGLAGCIGAPNDQTDQTTVTTTTRDNRTTPTSIDENDGDLIEEEPFEPIDSADGSRFTDVYRAVRDSVVQIRVGTSRGSGTGTGFVFDESHLVTNEHVVADATQLYVRYRTTGWREASVSGTDVYSDLAVLDIEDRPSTSSVLPLRKSDPPIGTEVVAIGNPFGLSGTVTAGIISGVDRTLSAPNNFSVPDAIQTDAPINPGNSGGPLVDLTEQVVGVISAGGGDNIGLAISAPLTRQIVPALIERGSYDHPYLGVSLTDVTPAIAAANDLPEATGVYVERVLDDGPSDGVLRGPTSEETVDERSVPVGGDVITHVAGEPVPTSQKLSSVLALQTAPDEPAEVRIWRDGQSKTVTVTIGTRPEP
ncbi:MAG: S1C family serine protease [archaeon]